MKKETIVTRKWGDRRKGKTDWARFDAMTEAEIEAAIASDPDWAGTEDIDWSKAELIMPAAKKPISIRLDEDVLTFFKRDGSGYQRRINAVLRSYMEQMSNPKRRA
ncbi:BrnA antitoxin family protein [Rhodopseudomonas sp. NSM]|uniref:BrnA antitoxin family protein n=1 Tax=Rhodopseudomonas sp. NSM TaxID=3457630 RepID=UPI004035CA2A